MIRRLVSITLTAALLVACNSAMAQPAGPESTGSDASWEQLYSGAQPTGEAQSTLGAKAAQPTDINLVKQWFSAYDQVRRNAQMNPKERKSADALLARGISMFIPGEDKVSSGKLLGSLVARYNAACEGIKGLPVYPETEKLHRGYYRYFSDASSLFGDYLKVQGNLLAKDAKGNPVAASLMARKQSLEQLDAANKALDVRLRNTFGIPPYKYR